MNLSVIETLRSMRSKPKGIRIRSQQERQLAKNKKAREAEFRKLLMSLKKDPDIKKDMATLNEIQSTINRLEALKTKPKPKSTNNNKPKPKRPTRTRKAPNFLRF